MKKRLFAVLVMGVMLLSVSFTALADWTGTIALWDAPRWRDENDDPYHWIKAKNLSANS